MTLDIRVATPNDAPTIAEFNQRMALETEKKTLEPAVVLRAVKRVFSDAAKGFYIVAESNAEIVGQLMITYEWSDWRDGWIWWIQSVYVRADHRRQGVFRSLYSELIAHAKRAGDVVAIRLYVEKDNIRAQTTYRQLGMRDPGYLILEAMLLTAPNTR